MLDETNPPPPPKAKPREQARELIARLVEAYPKAFFPLSARQVHPLKLGIHKELAPRVKEWGFEPLALRLALTAYIRHLRYQVALTKETHRIGLDGEAAGEVSAEHKAKAQEQVAAIRAQRKAADKPAAAPAEAAVEVAPAEAGEARKPRTPAPRPEGATGDDRRSRPPRRRPEGAPETRGERRPPRKSDKPERGPKPPQRHSASAPDTPSESAFAALLREALAQQGDTGKP